jgi:hypothetical protein
MGVFATMREGFLRAGRLWPLVLVHVGIAMLHVLLILLMLVLPVVVAFIALGATLGSMHDAGGVLHALGQADSLAGLIGGVALALLGFACFMATSISLAVFTVGGTAAVIKGSVLRGERFSTGVFMHGGRRHFKPMLAFTLQTGIALMGIFVGFGLVGGLAYYLYGALGVEGTRAGTFVSMAMALSIGLAFAVSLLAWYAVYQQGVALLVMDGRRAWESVRGAFAFLDEEPGAMALLATAVGLVVGAQVAGAVMISLVEAVPVVGVLVGLPMQIVLNVAGMYLGIALTATVFVFYARARGVLYIEAPAPVPALSDVAIAKSVETDEDEPAWYEGLSVEESTTDERTSESRAPLPDPLPPLSEPRDEG